MRRTESACTVALQAIHLTLGAVNQKNGRARYYRAGRVKNPPRKLLDMQIGLWTFAPIHVPQPTTCPPEIDIQMIRGRVLVDSNRYRSGDGFPRR